MAGPLAFKNGVKYIKLAKFDTGSVSSDLTIPLGEIRKIRVNYTDKGIIEYPIQTISEYPDYYLYRVVTTDATSSADNKQLDYNFTGSSISETIADGGQNIGNFDNELDTLNYFNTTTGVYLYGDTPNTPLTIAATCSFVEDASQTGDIDAEFKILKIDNVGNTSTVAFHTLSGTSISGLALSCSAALLPVEGEQYFLNLSFSSQGFTSPLWIADTNFSISTGSAYTTSTGTQIPTVLEPFFESKFTNGDYDVLLGNATEPRLSTLYFDVDYSTSQISPVNLQAILTGSAVRAQTPDSNYTATRSIRLKYEGSKNSTSGNFDRQLIQSTSSLSPINNYISAIVEFAPLVYPNFSGASVSGSYNAYSIILIDSLIPGTGIQPARITDNLLLDTNRVPSVSDFKIISKPDPYFVPLLKQILRPEDSASLFQYGDNIEFSSGSLPISERVVKQIFDNGYVQFYPLPSGSISSTGGSTVDVSSTGRGAIISKFISPTISQNLLSIVRTIGSDK